MSLRVEPIHDTDWATEVATVFAERVRPGARLCLATGHTLTPFYGEVTTRASLDGLTIFLLDEFGGLPLADPGRCLSMITRDLLQTAPGEPSLFAPDVDSADPRWAAARYGDIVADGGIDLAIVGLGSNGHVGMNEPGSTADTSTRVVDLTPATTSHATSYGATIPPTWGITVGMSELLAAREVWLLVTGNHKRDILHRVLHGAVDSDVPASYLTEHPNCTFFVDESAFLTGRG